jgi:hypothetical protein
VREIVSLGPVRAVKYEQGSPTVGLEDPQDLVSGDEPDLGDSVGVPEDYSDLGRTETPSSKLEDLVRDLLRGGLGPRGLRSSVRESRRGFKKGK